MLLFLGITLLTLGSAVFGYVYGETEEDLTR